MCTLTQLEWEEWFYHSALLDVGNVVGPSDLNSDRGCNTWNIVSCVWMVPTVFTWRTPSSCLDRSAAQPGFISSSSFLFYSPHRYFCHFISWAAESVAVNVGRFFTFVFRRRTRSAAAPPDRFDLLDIFTFRFLSFVFQHVNVKAETPLRAERVIRRGRSHLLV